MAKRIIRMPALKNKVGESKATIYRQITRGEFPRPIKLSTRSVGWLEDEIDHWLESRPRSK